MPKKKTEPKDNSYTRRISHAMDDHSVPRIYFNGFLNVTGTADITIFLERNDEPVVILNASYTTAKTLAQKLNNLIANLEQRTGREIMTTEDVAKLAANEVES